MADNEAVLKWRQKSTIIVHWGILASHTYSIRLSSQSHLGLLGFAVTIHVPILASRLSEPYALFPRHDLSSNAEKKVVKERDLSKHTSRRSRILATILRRASIIKLWTSIGFGLGFLTTFCWKKFSTGISSPMYIPSGEFTFTTNLLSGVSSMVPCGNASSTSAIGTSEGDAVT